MSIFTPCEGGVYKIPNDCADNSGSPPVIDIAGLTTGGIAYTGFLLELHTNHQFLHALDEFIYVFPFGDRVGELTVTGMGFLGDCAKSDGDGLCGIYGYYMENRLNPKKIKPITIQVGGCDPKLIGFLTGLRMETLRPEMPIMQWVLRFNVIVSKA